MIDALDKHINAQIETYKSNRYENSDSKGMSHIRRLLKGDYNKNNQSVLVSNQKGLQGYRTLEIQKRSDSINQRN